MRKLKTQGCNRPAFEIALLTILTVMSWLGWPERAQAQTQWTTAPNGTDIYKTSNGNVGIGTTTPVSQLEIAGGAPYLTLTHGNGPMDNSEVVYRSNGGFYKWGIINYADAYTVPELRNALTFFQFTNKNNTLVDQYRMVIADGGNVGIGTLSPAYKLDVAGIINASAIYQNGSPFSSSQWTTGASNISYSAGNVGIGTNAPAYRLDVQGGLINASGGLCIGGDCRTAWSQVGNQVNSQWTTSGSNIFYNSGNVGVGISNNVVGKLNVTNSGANNALDVSGATFVGINAQNAATANNQSSYGIVGATNAGGSFSGRHYGVYGYATGDPNNYNDGATIVGVRGDASSPFGTSSTPATTAGGYFSVTVNTPALGTVPTTPRGYGVYAKATGTSNSGTSTLYGVYIDTANSSAVPITFGLYQAGTAANNYFAGSVGLGTTNPGYKLDVQGGQINASGGLCIAGDCRTSWPLVGLGGGSPWTTSGSTVSYSSGNVGIGTKNPTAKLDINGDINVAGKINVKYQDIAEWVPAAHSLPPGTVVVLDPTQSNRVMASSTPYDTRVAGVVSAKPGLALGETGKDKVLVAMTGRVKVKVDATQSPIQVGDLLVTSGVEGVAMKSEPVDMGGVKLHRPGTMIGKALEPLEKGMGEILVLVSLQ